MTLNSNYTFCMSVFINMASPCKKIFLYNTYWSELGCTEEVRQGKEREVAV